MIIFESDPETKSLGMLLMMNAADEDNQVKLRNRMQGKPYRKVADNEGPLLEFLECYTFDEKLGMTFRQDKFGEMIRKQWRKKRIPKLQQLDTQYIIALEKNDTEAIADIVQRKAQLRDVTKQEFPKYEPMNGSLREYMLKYKNYLPECLL
jgi:hypothetical protein